MRVDDLDYHLPEGRIATHPVAPRDAAKLLVVGEPLVDATVRDLPRLLPRSLVVVNDTRVIPARAFGRKASGGRVEFLFVERLDPLHAPGPEEWLVLARASKPIAVGSELRLDGDAAARVTGRRDDGSLTVSVDADVLALLEREGELPLPPYLDRENVERDSRDYQTLFAARAGAVAAPTAGLHFTDELVAALLESGSRLARVTLHVGPGTFRPVKVDDLDEHPMHEERFEVGEEAAAEIARARAERMPVVAIGTTVVRALESAALDGGLVRAGPGRTNILIQPPYRFRVVDGLLTNFHLPRSTLLALVMARLGVERTRAVYEHAIAHDYRFFSYGDAMLIPPRSDR